MVTNIPEDPRIRSLVSLIRSQRISRRQLMQSAGLIGASAGLLALAGCGGASGASDKIVWGNWTYYLDFDESTGTNPTLDSFVEQAGFGVDYVEDIDDINTFYGKIKDALQLDQWVGYDVITLGDWMNARLIEAGQIQEFDYGNLPNVTEHLIDQQWDILPEDQGRHFTVPWQLPTTGWAWDKEVLPGGLHALDDLLKPELKGRVQVLSEMRNTMGIILAGQGVDPSSDWGDAEFDQAIAWLEDGLASGQIANVKGNDYTQDLETGRMAAGFVWTGDVMMMNAELGDRWGVEIPESGGMIDADSFTVPNGTSPESKRRVEELINYYYQPEVAAEVAAYVAYVTPVQGAQEAMADVDPSQVENPAIFPADEDFARLKQFRLLTPEEDQRYSTAFQKVLGL